MVSVKDRQLGLTSKDSLQGEEWLASITPGRTAQDLALIRRACEVAQRAHEGQRRASGEPYFHHCIAVANILVDLNLDAETLAAAVLHDVAEDTGVTMEDIRAGFGDAIAHLVDGVTKMKLIRAYKSLPDSDKQERTQAENLRKMLLAMAEDIRVVLIKLADRIHNMRTLAALPSDKQHRIAKETLDIYAPLANRLGIWQLKWELEDLSLRYLDPALYKRIAGMLDERRIDRERYLDDFVTRLDGELKKIGLNAEVTGRPKHIYSIWRKMERKKIGYHQIYDIRGVRILVDSIPDCYKALGVVHGLWQYIAGEFDDYIATPKENNYQSIHTAVVGPEGKTVEIQIRTREMHERNELGVAAHWRYKEGGRDSGAFDRKVAWLRSLLEWKEEIADAGDFVERFRTEVFQDRIYVFTPKGSVVDLPRGATPLDFAYHIHTEVGHRCRGAKVNGRMVQLTTPLETGQQVEIVTVKEAAPSRDWLNPHLGYLHSARARAKVQHWFRLQDYDKNVLAGRGMVERELKRLGLSNVNQEKLAEALNYSRPEDLFAAVAHGDIKSTRYLQAAQTLQDTRPDAGEAAIVVQKPARPRPGTEGFQIQGVGNVLTNMAHCCRPVPGDEIRGYITVGRGVTIHRGDCANLLRSGARHPERVIAVDWGGSANQTFPVDIQISAFDRHGLLNDITAVVANEKINVIAVNTLSNSRDHTASMRLTLEVPDIDTLSRVLTRINQLPNILQVRRVSR
ncbi:MAG: GTP diphosphokinase [Gammaproteobacteria bacterium]|nr:GTP diphosphokinase [Gammaproteobacteria bacterium]